MAERVTMGVLGCRRKIEAAAPAGKVRKKRQLKEKLRTVLHFLLNVMAEVVVVTGTRNGTVTGSHW